MEYLVLRSYLKMKNEKKIVWWRILLSKDKFNFIIFLLLILSGLISIYFIGSIRNQKWALLFVLAEVICLFWLNHRITRREIDSSKENIQSKLQYYNEVKIWLSEIGYEKKPQIKQMYYRVQSNLRSQKESSKRTLDFITKLLNLFLVPLLASIIAIVIDTDGTVDYKILSSVMFAILWTIIYVFIFGVIDFFSPFINKDYESMKQMLRDIQGVLDYGWELELSDVMEQSYCDY